MKKFIVVLITLTLCITPLAKAGRNHCRPTKNKRTNRHRSALKGHGMRRRERTARQQRRIFDETRYIPATTGRITKQTQYKKLKKKRSTQNKKNHTRYDDNLASNTGLFEKLDQETYNDPVALLNECIDHPMKYLIQYPLEAAYIVVTTTLRAGLVITSPRGALTTLLLFFTLIKGVNGEQTDLATLEEEPNYIIDCPETTPVDPVDSFLNNHCQVRTLEKCPSNQYDYNFNPILHLVDFEKVRDHIESFIGSCPTAHTLIALDVDDVLIWNEPLYGKVVRRLKRTLDDGLLKINEFLNFLSIAFRDHRTEVMHQDLPEWVKNLQERGFTMMALTRANVGRFGKVQQIDQVRMGQLARHDFNFKNQFPNYGNEVILRAGCSKYFYFNKGVLFTPRVTTNIIVEGEELHGKGLAIYRFLENVFEETGWRPQCAAFIDDRIENAQAFDEAMNAMHINSKTIVWELKKYKETDVDSRTVTKQYRTLIEQEKWLTEDS